MAIYNTSFEEAGYNPLPNGRNPLRASPAPRQLTKKYPLILSDYAPSLGWELGLAVHSAFGLGCSTVGPGVRTGVKIRTDIPSEVGSDLVCACVAAKDLAGAPCVIVDFDAAIAFSALGRTGDFLGAAIAPGMGTAAEALRDAAALLPEVSVGEGPQVSPSSRRSLAPRHRQEHRRVDQGGHRHRLLASSSG